MSLQLKKILMVNIKSNSFISIRSFGFLLGINTIIFILLAIIMPITYETDDDIVMLLVSSGSYSGAPDAHLVFINYAYGLILKLFYTFAPNIEWYTVFFSLIHITAISIISWCITNHEKSFKHYIIFLSLFYIIESWLILNLQFTTTAALCATASLLLFFSRETYLHRIIAVILFVFASLIRFEAAYLSLLICLPFIVYQFLSTNKKITYAVLILCFGIFSFAFKQYDIYTYKKDSAWAEFQEFNYYRGRITDNPNANSIKQLPSNISQTDYKLLLSFFPDTNIFENKTIQELYLSIDNVDIIQKLENIRTTFKEYSLFFIIISFIVCIQVISLKDKNKSILLLSSYLLLILVVCFISLNGLLKFRVFLTTMLPFSWLLFITKEDRTDKSYPHSSIVILLALFCFSNQLFNQKKMRRHIRKSLGKETSFILREYHPIDNEYIVLYLSSVRPETFNAFQVSAKYNDNKYVGLGWLSKIPFNLGKIDSHKDLINKNTILIEKMYFLDFISNLKEAILMHYNLNFRYEILLETDNLYLIRLIENELCDTNLTSHNK